jgi:hypothetical protein
MLKIGRRTRKKDLKLQTHITRYAGYKDYDSHLRGIDFDKPVSIVEHPNARK